MNAFELQIFFVLCVLFLIFKCSQLVHCNYRLHFIHKKRFGSLIYINSKNVPISQSLWLVESVIYRMLYTWSLKLFNLLHKTIWCLKQLHFFITYIRIYESMFEFVVFCLSLMFFGGVNFDMIFFHIYIPKSTCWLNYVDIKTFCLYIANISTSTVDTSQTYINEQSFQIYSSRYILLLTAQFN